jgi:hypothetical protein
MYENIIFTGAYIKILKKILAFGMQNICNLLYRKSKESCKNNSENRCDKHSIAFFVFRK